MKPTPLPIFYERDIEAETVAVAKVHGCDKAVFTRCSLPVDKCKCRQDAINALAQRQLSPHTK